MRVFVAGGTGAAGMPTVRALLAAGNEVILGATRSSAEMPQGASFVHYDALERSSAHEIIAKHRPDAIVNHVTRFTAQPDPKLFGQTLERNDHARETSTTHLLDAAERFNVKRFISQSVAFWYAPGAGLAHESDALWHQAPDPIGLSVQRLFSLERAVLERGAVVLRCGLLYGPNTLYGIDGDVTNRIATGTYPIIGGGEAMASFIHVDDVAQACAHALEIQSGIYNVVDELPCTYRQWITYAVDRLKAPPPRELPPSQVESVLGPALTQWLTRSRGAASTKLQATGWKPTRPSFMHGFLT